MIGDRIKIAERKTDVSPSEAQKKSGNYKKGKVTIKGLTISIENPKGSHRSGIDPNGNEWSIKMPFSYGYFNGTLGKDGDQIDVYIGDFVDVDFDVYIIDQILENGSFDEHKVMFGFKDKVQAKESYMRCYDKDWKGFGNITKISLTKFKEWINNKIMLKYPASKLNISSRMDTKNVDLGDRRRLIRLFGEVESNKTLENLISQAGNVDDFDELVVEIASPGGSVSEGLEIMMWLDKLSAMGKKIITVVVANAYSIASLIMLSANIKLISKHGKVMVHNPMVPELKYVNANDLEKHIEELRDLESNMYDLYEMFTGLDTSKIKELMDNETYLSPQEAVDYGFADMVVDIKPKSFEMTVNTKKDINMSKTINSLKKVIAMVNKSDYVNQVYTSVDGSELEIFQGDSSTFKVGDRTSIENGEPVLSDGTKLYIEDFVITKIDRSAEGGEIKEGEEASFNTGPTPKEEAIVEEPSVEKPVVEVPKESNDPAKVIEKTESTITTKEVQNAEIKEVITWELSVVNETFDIGDKVEYKPTDDFPEANGVGVGEFALEDGRKILTDSESIIQFIKPAPTVEALEEEPVAKDKEEEIMSKELEAKIEALEIKNKELEAKLGEIENKFQNSTKEIEAKLETSAKFEEVAAKAIDTIASSTQSGFKPEAKIIAKNSSKGSIFQQVMQKRGLNS